MNVPVFVLDYLNVLRGWSHQEWETQGSREAMAELNIKSAGFTFPQESSQTAGRCSSCTTLSWKPLLHAGWAVSASGKEASYSCVSCTEEWAQRSCQCSLRTHCEALTVRSCCDSTGSGVKRSRGWSCPCFNSARFIESIRPVLLKLSKVVATLRPFFLVSLSPLPLNFNITVIT